MQIDFLPISWEHHWSAFVNHFACSFHVGQVLFGVRFCRREPMPCQEDYDAYIKCCKDFAEDSFSEKNNLNMLLLLLLLSSVSLNQQDSYLNWRISTSSTVAHTTAGAEENTRDMVDCETITYKIKTQRCASFMFLESCIEGRGPWAAWVSFPWSNSTAALLLSFRWRPFCSVFRFRQCMERHMNPKPEAMHRSNKTWFQQCLDAVLCVRALRNQSEVRKCVKEKGVDDE